MSATTPSSSNTANHEANYAFFLVTPAKLAVMSTVTFGLYETYWLYKNWRAVKAAENADISPFWRSIFALFFTHSLLKRMAPSNPRLGRAYIVILLLSRLPRPWWLIGFLSPVPLMLAQKEVNQAQEQAVSQTYSIKAKVAIAVGCVLLALTVIGLFLPQS